MSIFGGSSDDYKIEQDLKDPEALTESFILDEVMNLSESDRQRFLKSEEASILEAKGLIGRKTIVRLNKLDDITRRKKMAAFQLAKEHDDILWKKLVLNRVKERQLIKAIVKKFGPKAERVAKVSQKEYLRGGHGKLVTKFDLSKNRETSPAANDNDK